MRLVLPAFVCVSVVVAFACGGGDSAGGPTGDGGANADGALDGGAVGDGGFDPNACPGDTCGGACGPCRAGKACKVDADCASNACENDVCVQTAGCYSSGFCWDNPRPSGAQLTAIRGSGPNDVWAVGDEQYVLHWNGKRWRAVPAPDAYYFRAVTFADATHGWAVGGGGDVFAYDGTSWKKQAKLSALNGQLWDVQALAANDVWAVGDLGTVSHFDGTEWKSLTAGGLGRLRAVWAANKDDVWIGGDGGKLYKWGGGTTWTPEALQGNATTEIYALGGPSAATMLAGTRAGLYARSGATWAPTKTFQDSNSTGIEDIFTLDATHAYAAGIDHFERWNGTTWTTDTPPSTGRGFFGTWASSANDVWLAGVSGELLHHDGVAWKDFAERFTFETSDAYSVGNVAVAAIDTKSLVMVAEKGQVARKSGLTGKWTKEVIPGASDVALRAVSANGPNDIVVAGNGIYRWNGTAWKEEKVSKSSGWNAVTRVDPMTPWLVGNSGTIAKWNGMQWVNDETSGTTASLRGVWAADAMNVWAVGDQGTILRWNGVAWEKETPPTPGVDYLAVWGSSANDVWIAPGSGKILHRVNGAWKEEDHVVGNRLGSVSGTGPNDVWFAGQSPAGIVHWDGAKFTVARHNQAIGTITTVGTSVYLVSANGYVLQKE